MNIYNEAQVAVRHAKLKDEEESHFPQKVPTMVESVVENTMEITTSKNL
jgi:hypothetical protein